MPNNEGPAICGSCLVSCSVSPLCLCLLQKLDAPTRPVSVVGKEAIIVDYCVPFPLFPNWQCFSSRWSWQADLSALGKEWGREILVLAEEGSFSWQAGKDPA